jgi:hypothetical protein
LSIKRRRPKNSNQNRYPGGPRKPQGSHRSGSGSWDAQKNFYTCEVCGSNVPGSGAHAPLCPRCMIPMQKLNSRGHASNRKPHTHTTQKPVYDYSSRLYHQTEGHPQYVGLPRDHPDPSDEEATAAYLARKQAQRNQRKSDAGTSSSRRSRKYRRFKGKPADVKETKDLKKTDGSVSSATQKSVDKPTRKPVREPEKHPPKTSAVKPAPKSRKKPLPKTDTDQKPETVKPQPRKSSSRLPKAKPVREEDYMGTALSSDQPVAVMLNSNQDHDAAIADNMDRSTTEKPTPVKPKPGKPRSTTKKTSSPDKSKTTDSSDSPD